MRGVLLISNTSLIPLYEINLNGENKMKYKNIEIINVINFLSKFGDMKLPAKISFAIIKNQNYFNKEYKDYTDALKKVYESYSDYFKKNDHGDIITNDASIPIIGDKEISQKMYNEINDLLFLEVKVERFYIDESVFDYDDSKYDVLTPKDMFGLMDFLCNKKEEKKE